MGPADDGGQPGLISAYGLLHDEDLSDAHRADRLADLLVTLLADSGPDARRSTPVQDPHPAVAVHLDGVPYLIAVVWSAVRIAPTFLRGFQQTASGRTGIRIVLLSMSGFTAAAQKAQVDSDPMVALMDRLHFEAMLCRLASAEAIKKPDVGHCSTASPIPG